MNADDLLNRIVHASWDEELETLLVEAERYLDAPKDEPVAIIEEDDYGCFGEILPDKSVRLGQFLYLHPPTKTAPQKPLTDRESLSDFLKVPGNGKAKMKVFLDGIRFAEKFYKITGDSDA